MDITLAGVDKCYQRGRHRVSVLRGLDFACAAGELVAIMGPSGSGKSSLIHLIGGMDRPDAGSVRVGAAQLTSMNNAALVKWRAHAVGFVFQQPFLLGALSAWRNVELPLLLTDMRADQRRRRVALALELVGLADRGQHRPQELSGGEEQRVAIARAVVGDPPLLICDEPTGSLDRAAADQILVLLRTLQRELRKTVLIVSHDPQVAHSVDRIMVLDGGKLVAAPSPRRHGEIA
ncbi:ABC transporter ATP-binding protein [Massilia sp. DWR3-1-1]|uniref:ABC transporter ATP-binding protein n=1 Tax=Massilia sp. DWR3-1-1 TaxID=2804559 RepID=UPI003CF055B7